MRLNHDCIRDILLYIEDHTPTASSTVCLRDLFDSLSSKYDNTTIMYHITKMAEADFVPFPQGNVIYPLMYKGHEHLDSIRDKGIFEKVKECGLTSMSVDLVKELSKEIALSIAKNQLQRIGIHID